MQEARADLKRKEWKEAKVPLAKLIELYPAQTGEESAYAMLAAAQRELSETNAERETLAKLASMEEDDLEAYARLIELDEARQDWAGAATNAERYLAVNPLVPLPYRGLARASEELERAAPAIRSFQRLLLLDPPDPADTHFRLARQLHLMGDQTAAKRQTLEALEEAPRFRDAQRLLLELEKNVSLSPPAQTKP
jgi:tetratricopeptide (TPR) repeat protein